MNYVGDDRRLICHMKLTVSNSISQSGGRKNTAAIILTHKLNLAITAAKKKVCVVDSLWNNSVC